MAQQSPRIGDTDFMAQQSQITAPHNICFATRVRQLVNVSEGWEQVRREGDYTLNCDQAL